MASPGDAVPAPAGAEAGWERERSVALARLDHLLDRARRARTRLEEERARLADAEALQHRGDLLKAHFHMLRRGMDRVRVVDYLSGAPVEIALDPALTPEENLRRAYRAYQRAVRGRGVIAERLEHVARQVARLARAREECAVAPARAALRRAYATAFPAVATGSPGRAAAAGVPARAACASPYRVFVSSEGWPILVGKDGASNDLLTFRVAKPRDLWLHVADRSGAHVVVRRCGAEEPPSQTVLEAAILAVYFSAARGGGEGEVRIADVRDVRRVRGAPAGTVRLLRHREMRVRLDRAAVARLLERRAASDPGPGPARSAARRRRDGQVRAPDAPGSG